MRKRLDNLAWATTLALAAGPGAALAQTATGPAALPAAAPPRAAATGPATAPAGPDEAAWHGGASLNVDPDLESLLRRAHEYLDDRKYREAVTILQHALDHAAGRLSTRDGRTYRPMTEDVEALLAGLPPEGLALYRLSADGSARALMAQADDVGEAALAEVARRYFISSVGDDAAFELSGQLLDRHDFVPARRLLDKILRVHPDPSVRRAQVLARLALACARGGDRAGAARAWEQLRQLPEDSLDSRLLDRLAQSVAGLDAAAPAPPPGDDQPAWPLAFGSPSRRGHMPPLPETSTEDGGLWTLLWRRDLDLGTIEFPSLPQTPVQAAGQSQTRSQILARWGQNSWMPAGQMLLDRGRAIVRLMDQLVCLDPDSGRLIWQVADVPRQAPDPMSRFIPYYNPGGGLGPYPATPLEVVLFADRVSKSVSLVDGVVFHIEGHAGNAVLAATMVAYPGQPSVGGGGNTLAAFQADNGKLRWRVPSAALEPPESPAAATPPTPAAPRPAANRPAMVVGGPFGIVMAGGSESPEAAGPARFLAAPVPCGGRLIVPFEFAEGLWLAALDPADGRVVWRTNLCSGPHGASNALDPVALAADGSDLFVLAGRGVVFALDGAEGSIRWATRYQRIDAPAPGSPSWGGVRARTTANSGWDEDFVFPTAAVVAALPSDSPRLLVLDRHSGQVLSDQPKGALRYALGVHDDRLYVAGSDAARCYDLRPEVPVEGRQLWQARLERSLGRGLIMAATALLPERQGVACIDLRDGRRLGAFRLATPDGDPVGNLYTDGQRLLALGMERVYALVDGRLRLTVLDRRIAAGDAGARLERAQLYRQMSRLAPAAEDLRTLLASDSAPDPTLRDQARRALLETLLQLAAADPNAAQELLAEAQRLARPGSDQLRISLALAAHELAAGRLPRALDLYAQVAADSSDVPVLLDGDPACQTLASNVAARALRTALAQADGAALEAVAARARQALQSLTPAQASIEACLAVARSYPDTPAGFEAAALAARKARDANQFERAELILRSLADSGSRAHAAAGLAALADLHAQARLERLAADAWRRLARDFPEQRVALGDQTLPAAELAAQALARLPAEAQLPEVAYHGLTAPTTRLAWELKGSGYRLLDLRDPETPQPLDHRLLVADLAPGGRRNELICFDVRGQPRRLWVASLPSDPDLSAENSAVLDEEGRILGDGRVIIRGGAALTISTLGPGADAGGVMRDGHVAVFTGSDQIVGLGLISGKWLWSIPIGRAAGAGGGAGSRGVIISSAALAQPLLPGGAGRRLAAGAGVVVQATVDKQRLLEQVRVFDASTGRWLWTRTIERQAIDSVAVAGDFVALVLQDSKEVWVCDRLSGARRGQFSLADRAPGSALRWTSQGLIYGGNRGLTLRQLPGGEVRWVGADGARQSRAVLLAPDVLALVPGGGKSAAIIDLVSGKTRVTIEAPPGSRGLQDLALAPSGTELYALAISQRGEQQLRVVRRSDGQVLHDVVLGRPAGPRVSAADLALCGAVLPVLQAERPRSRPAPAGPTWKFVFTGLERLAALDGAELPLDSRSPPAEALTQAWTVRAGLLIVPTNQGLKAYGPEPPPAGPRHPPDPRPAQP